MWYLDTTIDKWLKRYPVLREMIKDDMINPRPYIDHKFAGIEFDNNIHIFTYRNKYDGKCVAEKLNKLI